LFVTASAWNAFTAGRAIREDWLFSAIRSKLAPDEQEELAKSIELLNRLVDPRPGRVSNTKIAGQRRFPDERLTWSCLTPRCDHRGVVSGHRPRQS
jgi:hypothetical protein